MSARLALTRLRSFRQHSLLELRMPIGDP
jgi:hypothetical protein